MAYIVTNNSLVGEVEDNDPAIEDPTISYGVSEVHVDSFNFDEWFLTLPEGTKVVKRSGHFEFAKDKEGMFLEETDEDYFEPYFVPHTTKVLVR